MCGRYALHSTGHEIAEKLGAVVEDNLRPRYNIAPMQEAPVLMADGVFRAQRWGWKQHSGLLINARSETAAQKPAFRRVWQTGRCLIPANLFYEWQRENPSRSLPFAVAPEQGGLFVMAGLIEKREDGAPAFVILTEDAQPAIRAIHPRQPVIMLPEQARGWLEGAALGESPLLRAWRVSPRVNKTAEDDPELIEPVSEQEQSPQLGLF